MKRRSKEDWRELIKQQVSSGLSVADFCQQHDLGQTYFYKRKSELNQSTEAREKTAFIKVGKKTLNSAQSAIIKMQYQRTQISLPVSISPLWLAEFIKALA
jgi:transposase-like protein